MKYKHNRQLQVFAGVSYDAFHLITNDEQIMGCSTKA